MPETLTAPEEQAQREHGLGERIRTVIGQFYGQFDGVNNEWFSVREVFSDRLIAYEERAGQLYRVAYEWDDENGTVAFASRAEFARVRIAYVDDERQRSIDRLLKKSYETMPDYALVAQFTSPVSRFAPAEVIASALTDGIDFDSGTVTVTLQTEPAEVGSTEIRTTIHRAREAASGDRSTFVISDNQPDRYNTRVNTRGVERDDFNRNPLALWQHGRDPQRGYEPIGHWENLRVTRDGLLVGDLVWSTDPEDTFAQRLHEHVRAGRLSAVSLSVRILETSEDRLEDGRTIPVFERTELLEVSLVAVPGNASALVIDRTDDSAASTQLALLSEQLTRLTRRLEAAGVLPASESEIHPHTEGEPDPAPRQERDASEPGTPESSADESEPPAPGTPEPAARVVAEVVADHVDPAALVAQVTAAVRAGVAARDAEIRRTVRRQLGLC